MEFSEDKVEEGAGGVVISNQTKQVILSDGSCHNLPVVNSSALKRLWGYTSHDEVSMEETDNDEVCNNSPQRSPLPSSSNSAVIYTEQQNSTEPEHSLTNQEATGPSTETPIKSLKHLFQIISTQ